MDLIRTSSVRKSLAQQDHSRLRARRHVIVNVNVVEGGAAIQTRGVVITKRSRGLNSSFIVHQISVAGVEQPSGFAK